MQTHANHVRNEIAPASVFLHSEDKLYILLDGEPATNGTNHQSLAVLSAVHIAAVIPHPEIGCVFLALVEHGPCLQIIRWKKTADGIAETVLYTALGCTTPIGFSGQKKGFYCTFKGWVCEMTFRGYRDKWNIACVSTRDKLDARHIIPVTDGVLAIYDQSYYVDFQIEAGVQHIICSSASGCSDWVILADERSLSVLDMRDPVVRTTKSFAYGDRVSNFSRGDTLVLDIQNPTGTDWVVLNGTGGSSNATRSDKSAKRPAVIPPPNQPEKKIKTEPAKERADVLPPNQPEKKPKAK